jgi:hypothetical protein
MKLPKAWNDVRLFQFKELRQLEKGEGYLAYQLDALAILADVNSEDLEDLEIDELNKLFNSVKFVLSEPKKAFKSTLTIEEEDYIFKPFNKLTLFEFIDLEYFLTNDYIVHISHIASVFYRRIDKDKWNNIEFEPYIFSPFERFELFDDVFITDVYGILTDYLKYRENFMQKYENLFNDNDEDDEEDDDINDFDSVEQYKDSLKQKEHGKKAKKWGWESLLYDLCEGDLTKMDDIGNQSLIFVFNMLSMRKDMGHLETSKF